ncbi:MAG: hypothetical protein FWD17_07090 [Polyangiaceae bacterium]|nr:hypothetical protein [Polyangiaceae bacterium]
MGLWAKKRSNARGIICMVAGMLAGAALGWRAWLAWHGGAHGLERSVGIGVVAAGMLSAGLDVTFRLTAREAGPSANWSAIAFHPRIGGHIDGVPAWFVSGLVAAIALIVASH